MKIADAALQMNSSHTSLKKHELTESLSSWGGNRRLDLRDGQRASLIATQPLPAVQISDVGQAAQSSEASAIQSSLDAAENDPMLRLIRAMITMLTGEEIRVFKASDLNSNSPAPSVPAANPSQAASQTTQSQAAQQVNNFGFEYNRHESYYEAEQTSFSASGVVRTTDGKEIDFSLALSMSRSYYEESRISIRQGNAPKTQDPLVLNFEGTAAQLSNQRFKFDLDADGKTEDINLLAGGSGFLALDRNGDGKINNGSELFGTKSGDGFADLAALDSDNNGWIDENDSVYEQLRVWIKDASGKDLLSTLKQANVGAIALARTATPFDIKTSSNELLGQIRSSGIFLREDGKVGTVQQVDLTT
jgi:hypothetical protein